MRCDQHVGLPVDAWNFLREMRVKPKRCPCCGLDMPLPVEGVGNYSGMFDDVYTLYRYRLIDGGWADELLQNIIWSSGPMFFLGLKVFDSTGALVQEFLWDEQVMDTY